jgi:hypothetical protein
LLLEIGICAIGVWDCARLGRSAIPRRRIKLDIKSGDRMMVS